LYFIIQNQKKYISFKACKLFIGSKTCNLVPPCGCNLVRCHSDVCPTMWLWGWKPDICLLVANISFAWNSYKYLNWNTVFGQDMCIFVVDDGFGHCSMGKMVIMEKLWTGKSEMIQAAGFCLGGFCFCFALFVRINPILLIFDHNISFSHWYQIVSEKAKNWTKNGKGPGPFSDKLSQLIGGAGKQPLFGGFLPVFLAFSPIVCTWHEYLKKKSDLACLFWLQGPLIQSSKAPRGSPPPTQQIDIRNTNQLSWAIN